MNVKRLSSIALAMSITLVSVGCNAQQYDSNVPSHMQQETTTPTHDYNATDEEYSSFGTEEVSESEQPSPQSRYAITFTEFFIKKEDECYGCGQSDYLFYVYNPDKKTYKKRCFNNIKGCKNVQANKGDTVHLNVTVSEFAASDYVYLRVLEADNNWNVLSQTPDTHKINSVSCLGKYYKRTCLKIPVQYLLDNRHSCLTMATKSGNDEICLSYKIETQQKLHTKFRKNLEKLSALYYLFKGNNLVEYYRGKSRYNKRQSVRFFDFSRRLSELKNQRLSSVTFYANERKFPGLPMKIAQPVVNYLAKNYPSGLWVINGADGVLAAYGANKLTQSGIDASPIRIQVKWPGVSNDSINNWLKTPEKGQRTRPYHTLRLYYKRGRYTITKPSTGLKDTVDTVSTTLKLPGRYTIGTHLNIGQVKLSGIFSLLQNQGNGAYIHLTPKDGKIKAQLDLPSGYEYRYEKNCQPISKTVSEWFKTDKVTLQCPRLPKSLIVPDFVNGKVQLNARNKELSLGLRFEERSEQTSLTGWRIGKIFLTQTGTEGRMLVKARDLPEPKNGKLTLIPPKDAFSIFYLNEPISVQLSKPQQDYLYTAKSVPGLNGSAVINLDVPNPKERPVETFKNSNNPWTPKTLTFLCDGTQSDTSLCGKTCTLESTNAAGSVGLICQDQKINMPLKQLKGYLMTTRFLGERWGTDSVRLKGQSLTNFFCGAWQRLFPLDNQVIVMGSDKNSVQMAYLTNPFKGQRISQYLLLSAFTANRQPVWSYSIKPGEKGKDSLMNSVIWQLDSVSGRYDYYLHQASGCMSNGQRLTLPIRPEAICHLPSQRIRCQRSSVSSRTRKPSSRRNTAQIAQIDIVAVFAEKYNFQQQVLRPKFSMPGLNIPKTGQQERRAGWMKIWDKHTTQQSLRNAINRQASRQQRNPSVKLHYRYDDENDNENKWLWSSMRKQAHLKNAPVIGTRRNMVEVVNISNVVLNNDIRPRNRRLDNQVNSIVKYVTKQWQPNGDYLLVILSDGISEQEMAQLKNIRLPRGNGKRRLFVLTSDFLPTDSQSLLLLPKLPSDTGHHTVISMYDKNWVEQLVTAIFAF
jgi:hypothetical protein